METVFLGNTGIQVSKLCFGTLTMGPLQQNLPLQTGAGLLELAYDLGIVFWDTAELYGTYPYIKQALSSRPDAVICTKSYSYDVKTAAESFEKATREIGRDYIDIFLLHEQESEHTIRGHYEAIEYFIKRKQEGLIGAIGLSTHYVAGIRGANKYPEMEMVFPLINYAGIGIADGTAADMLDEIKKAYSLGKGVFAMKPLGGGHLLSSRKEAFAFFFDKPEIQSVAVGMQTPEEIHYNCALFSGQEPDAALLSSISAQPRKLLIHDWCEGCGTCVQRCKNGALALIDGHATVKHEACALCGYCAATCPQFCIKVV